MKRLKIDGPKLPAITAAAVIMALAAVSLPAQAPTQVPLPGSAIAQFVDPLPSLNTIVNPLGQVVLEMSEFQSQVLPSTFVPASGGPYQGTWVWGYLEHGQAAIPSYIGPVIVATRGTPTEIKWVNKLGNTDASNVLAYKFGTDQTLHWADPLNGEANDAAHAVIPGQLPASPWDQHYAGPVPAVPHLHGGMVPPVIDGGPDQWFTSDGAYHGHAYYTHPLIPAGPNEAVYRYPNSQQAGLLWFHDHVLGLTRLGVYAGLAGAYLLTDPPNDPANLPPLVPLVVQDRMFDTEGQLYFPAGVPFVPNPEHPYWVPEFVGDTIVVNGKVWPYLNVEPKRYTFFFINGSNARTYELFLVDPVTKVMGPPMWQIATDGGYLDAPVKIDPNSKPLSRLTLMPGERAEVIVDFAGLAPGTTLILRNTARMPYPGGAPAQGGTVGRIMQFRIVNLVDADTSYDPASGAPLLANPLVRLADPATGALAPGVTANKTRQLTLNEVMDPPVTVNGVAYPGGPREVLVNNTKWGGEQAIEQPGQPAAMLIRGDFTPITLNGITNYISEYPLEGDTEVWEIVNLTADAHPIHTHLVQFQLLNRQNFNANKYTAVYNGAFPAGMFMPAYGPPLDYNSGNPRALGGNPDITPYLQGPVRPPAANEVGWKDTIMVPPGMVTRFVVRFAPFDLATNLDPLQYAFDFDPEALGYGYVWHCHIIDHEDNEMMRPYNVQPKAGATRFYIQGVDY